MTDQTGGRVPSAKTCSRCGGPGPFHVDRNKPDGLTGQCKACRAASYAQRKATSVPRGSQLQDALADRRAEIWGTAAPQAPPSRPRAAERAPGTGSLLIIPDVHFPCHDPRAVEAVLEFAHDRRPSRCVQLGDCYDFYSASSYAKRTARMRAYGGTLYEEAQSALGFWRNLVEFCGEVDFLPGNHEERLHRNVVEANPALHEHPALELANILQLPAGVRCHPYGHKLRVGNLVLCHGDKLLNNLERRKHGAAAVLAKYPNQHTIYGHTHRIESYGNVVYNDDRPRTFTAWNVGWLGDYRQADYVEDPSWRQGFAFVEFWRDPEGRERFTFQQLEFVDGRFSWGGKVYGR